MVFARCLAGAHALIRPARLAGRYRSVTLRCLNKIDWTVELLREEASDLFTLYDRAVQHGRVEMRCNRSNPELVNERGHP